MIHPSVEITGFINKGMGLGKLENGQKVMVRQALPGEKVSVRITRKKKNYILGEIHAILNSSPERVEAECSYYGECGGCDLQHASYDYQLVMKRHMLEDLFRRQKLFAKKEGAQLIEPVLASPIQTGYRQRIRLQVDDRQRLGYLEHNSSRIVPVSRCLIAREEINSTLRSLEEETTAPDFLRHCKEVELCWNPETGFVTLLMHMSRKPRPADFSKADKARKALNGVERIFFKGEDFPITAAAPKAAPASLSISYQISPKSPDDLYLQWEIGSFCQVNLQQNLHLIDLVIRYASPEKSDTVLDLFCGMGNFSIPLARRVHSLLGAEGQGASIRCARINSDKAGLTNTVFIKKPIHTVCEQLVAENKIFDCIIADPPRQGMPGLAAQLSTLCRKRMVYISCDPATLVRDLSELCRHGFTVKKIQPVDMFPQTHHIETVVVLEKN